MVPKLEMLITASSLMMVLMMISDVRAAGISQVTKCQSSLTWTFNDEGSNPCAVAAALEGDCFATGFNIPAINSSSMYQGARPQQSNNCQCSTVAYALVSACAQCQSAGFIDWTDWSINCVNSDTAIGSYPRTIPNNVTVPVWAYVKPQDTSNTWNAQTAFQIHQRNIEDVPAGSPPNTTPSLTANASSSSSSGTSPSVPTIPPSASPTGSNSSGSSHHTNAGAIAGGVVGGLVGLAALAILGFYLWRRFGRRRSLPPSAQFVSTTHKGKRSWGRAEKADLMPASPPPFSPPPESTLATLSQRYYDPSDPSTFPTTPPPTSPGHGAFHPAPFAHQGANLSQPSMARGYTGAAEV